MTAWRKMQLACNSGVKHKKSDDVVILLSSSSVTHLQKEVNKTSWSCWYIFIFRYFVSKGAVVDQKGGILNATPLHWAVRWGFLITKLRTVLPFVTVNRFCALCVWSKIFGFLKELAYYIYYIYYLLYFCEVYDYVEKANLSDGYQNP